MYCTDLDLSASETYVLQSEFEDSLFASLVFVILSIRGSNFYVTMKGSDQDPTSNPAASSTLFEFLLYHFWQ